MARIYSQQREDRNMVVIGDSLPFAFAQNRLFGFASEWVKSKRGRTAKAIGGLEYFLYFSDGKMAATIWVDPYPAPAGEPKFTPATGEIPGLKV